MSYRPEGWTNPYLSKEFSTIRDSIASIAGSQGFEAGADAMLAALREHGTGYDVWTPHINRKTRIGIGTGRYVFIPDDVQL